MHYYGVRRDGDDDHLEHLFGIGGQRKKHKYLMRVQSGDGYRYLYTPAEVAAYKAGSAVSAVRGAANTVGKTVGSAAGSVADKVSGAIGIKQYKNMKTTGKMFKSAHNNYAKNVAAVTAMIATDKHFTPGGRYEKGWANTLKNNQKEVAVTAAKYNRAKQQYDKSLMGKVSNSVVGKAAGAGVKGIKSVGGKIGNLGKKASQKIKWETASYSTYGMEGAKPVRKKYKLYRKRIDAFLNPGRWNIHAVGTSEDGKHYQWSNRPHSRKSKRVAGTAVVKAKRKDG